MLVRTRRQIFLLVCKWTNLMNFEWLYDARNAFQSLKSYPSCLFHESPASESCKIRQIVHLQTLKWPRQKWYQWQSSSQTRTVLIRKNGDWKWKLGLSSQIIIWRDKSVATTPVALPFTRPKQSSFLAWNCIVSEVEIAVSMAKNRKKFVRHKHFWYEKPEIWTKLQSPYFNKKQRGLFVTSEDRCRQTRRKIKHTVKYSCMVCK